MNHFWPTSPLRCRIGVALALLLLAGCAAQNAFRAGEAYLQEGKLEAAVSKLADASRIEPGSARYRIAYLTARDKWLIELERRAESAFDESRYPEAEALYKKILTTEGGEERAISGLRRIDAAIRRDKTMSEAQKALSAKDLEKAERLLAVVRLEHPTYEPAAKLLQSIQAMHAPKESATSTAQKRPISIEFKDAPLKTIFDVISRTSGLNFLFDKDVKTDAKASIFLKNTTTEAAIRLILLTNQLDQLAVDDNTVLVYPNTAAKQKDYQQLVVRSFNIVNAPVKNISNTLKTILKVRDIVTDDKLNILIVRDTPEVIHLAEKLIALHDRPEPEVMLEVEILEVSRSRLADVGIRWPDQIGLTPLASSSGGTLTVADLKNLTNDRIGAAVGPTTLIAKGQDTNSNLLANPRIRARNMEEAKILIGQRVPNITTTATSTGFASESVTYVDVGLKLQVEPTIYLSGDVAIKISLEVSNIIDQLQTKSGALAYRIGTRTASTILRLKDGENQVLAGLINDEDRRTKNKIPVFGDIPLLGRLFGNQANNKDKTEIVLSITPRIVRNLNPAAATVAEFVSGTEAGFRSGSLDTGGGQQAPAANASQPNNAPQPPNRSGNAANPGNAANSNLNGANYPGSTNASPGLTSLGTGSVTTSPSLRWQGPSNLRLNDTFSVQLVMQSEQPIVSIPLAVSFDPHILQVVSIVEGDFLKQGGAQTSFTSRVDPNGQILITGTRAGDAGATALGSVMTVNFRATAVTQAETQVQLLTTAPVALGGGAVQTQLPVPHAITVSP